MFSIQMKCSVKKVSQSIHHLNTCFSQTCPILASLEVLESPLSCEDTDVAYHYMADASKYLCGFVSVMCLIILIYSGNTEDIYIFGSSTILMVVYIGLKTHKFVYYLVKMTWEFKIGDQSGTSVQMHSAMWQSEIPN